METFSPFDTTLSKIGSILANVQRGAVENCKTEMTEEGEKKPLFGSSGQLAAAKDSAGQRLRPPISALFSSGSFTDVTLQL